MVYLSRLLNKHWDGLSTMGLFDSSQELVEKLRLAGGVIYVVKVTCASSESFHLRD